MNYEFRGKYLPSNNYNKLDVVVYKKTVNDPERFFLCINSHTSSTPREPNPYTDTAYWALLNADSNFPESVDSFVTRTNLSASEVLSAKRYQDLLLKPSRSPSEDEELNNIAQNLRNQIPLPEDWNKLHSAIQNMQLFIKDRIEGYLNSKQVEMENKKNEFITFVNDQSIAFNTKLNRFSDKGAYSGTVQYYQWNTVKYNNETYLCLQDTLGHDPTNQSYWSKIAAKGDRGEQGLSGLGLVYRGSYDGTFTYRVQDAVNYGGSIYFCKVDAPIGVNPSDSNYWTMFMSKQNIPISPTPPSTPSENDLWLDTTTTNPLLKFWNGSSWISAIAHVLDNSITDSKIGNRTIDPNTSTPFSLSGTVTQILSWIGKYLTQITGRPLFQAPRTTLENAVKRDGDEIVGVMTFDGGGQLVNLKAGTADHVYMGLYADSQAPNTRSGYFGYTSTGTTSLAFQNEMLNGDILIGTVGSGKVKINNNEALSTANGVKKMHILAAGTDLNTIVDSGFYRMESGHLNAPPACEYGQLLVMHGGSDTIAQIATGYQTRVSFIRHGNPTNVGGTGKWSPWYLMSQTHNFRETASSKDEATGVYKVVDYRRSDGTYYAQSVLSNPDTNGYFRTLSYTYYDQTGTVALQTDVWTLTYDDDGKIISKVPNF